MPEVTAEDLREGIRAGRTIGPAENNAEKPDVPATALREVLLEPPANANDPSWLRLQNVRIDGALDLKNCRLTRRVSFAKCTFEDLLDWSQSHIVDIEFVDCEIKVPMIFNQIQVEWNLVLNGSRFEQGIYADGAKIGGRLEVNEANISSGTGVTAITAEYLDVGAELLGDNAMIDGQLKLVGGRVGGEMSLNRSRIEVAEDDNPAALSGEGLIVEGGLFCEDLEVVGQISIVASRIEGVFNMKNAKLRGSEDDEGVLVAIRGDRIRVGGTILWTAMEATGAVMLLNANIGGQLSMDRVQLSGEFLLLGAKISGEFGLLGATLDGAGRPALSADRLEVAGGMFCQGLEATGEIRLLGAQISHLYAAKARFSGEYGLNEPGIAFDGSSLTASGGLHLQELDATGTLNFGGAKISGQLILDGAELKQEDKTSPSLSFTSASADELKFEVKRIEGIVDLRNSTVRTLRDKPHTVLEQARGLHLEGFSYETLGAPLSAKERIPWIDSSPDEGYHPRDYVELAGAYRRIGYRADARKVEIESAKKAIQQLPHWRPRWLWNKLLWITTGSGYRNWLAAAWLLGLLAIGSLLFWLCQDTFLPLTQNHPDFNPILYAVDATIPVIEVGQQRAFAATGWLRWVALFLTISGYALVTAVIAAAAGLLNPDQRT